MFKTRAFVLRGCQTIDAFISANIHYNDKNLLQRIDDKITVLHENYRTGLV